MLSSTPSPSRSQAPTGSLTRSLVLVRSFVRSRTLECVFVGTSDVAGRALAWMGGENADDGDENADDADENHVPSYTAM